jgi:transcriptional regulator with XRE-family HTH domain
MSASFAGRLVRAARVRADLSQRALAKAAGVPPSTVVRIESGHVSPRVDTFVRLLEAAGTSSAVKAFIDLDKGGPEIREMLALTPAQRVERLTVEVRCYQVLLRTVDRIRRASREADLASS